ncbi:unnamed protein product [Rotaria sp. Silwood1]|nr:unnamed protein product [Rotaria sp. Silwood1]CAF3797420.1 unnamed protein product [Rotaria sp. Silwood1]CAF4708060.1 unnamed protein product [Rotaria sp. Silwood1]CAF4816524.1 unnamed protein product [Rotaria sp. Silwood1]CAF4873049.1 unnamed protein product [Rotaria sp. Silwood1]
MSSIEISSSSNTINSSKLKQLLKFESNKYSVIKKESSTPLTGWWEVFGYPAKLDEHGVFQRISGYVSCFNCYCTFIYGNNSGTTRLRQHAAKCSKTTCSSSITVECNDSSSSRQATLAQHGFKKCVKINEKDIDNIKRLSAQWICQDIRPFCTLRDAGHKYGVVDVDEILRSRFTIARTIADLAESYRQHIKQLLIEPLKARAVTICPDFWSDCYKNISYLGLHIVFVDANHKMFSIDLFCRPFYGDKTSASVIKVLQEHLIEFGIDNLDFVNIVSDRGSNFVAAFRDFKRLFCFGHRLNNIVKTPFFGNTIKKKKSISIAPTTINNNFAISYTTTKIEIDNSSVGNDVFTSEQSSEDEDDYMLTSVPAKHKGRINNIGSSNGDIKLARKMSINDIPIEARSVIIALNQCKKIVKYIKKCGLNKDIENAGGGTVHQSIIIRWISTLKDAMSSYRALLDYNLADGGERSREGSPVLDDDLVDELQGINFFWNRIRCLLNEMFTLDIRHYVATALHPKYRSLTLCSSKERCEYYEYIRKQIKLINTESNKLIQGQIDKPVQKKFKKDLFSRFESNNFADGEESEESEEDTAISSRNKKSDELDRYLNFEIDRSKLQSDPLPFWKEHQDKFPCLSRYARSIHSIPATSASVERQFSAAGLIISERRSNLKPEQLDNVLLIRSSIRQVHIFALIYSFTASTVFFSMAAVFSYGGILVEQNAISFKSITIVMNCMIFGAQSVGHSAAMAPDYGKAVSAAQKMLALFAREPKISIDSHGLKLKNFTGDIHLRAVNFAYATRPRVPILNNFNLDIKSGTSGNGKSTLLHLLEHFYDVQSGSVHIDSKDLRGVNLNWWRSQVGMVTQEPVLFNVSIAENLAYGDLSRHVTMDEIIEAAKNVNIHDVIQQLPQGYDTCVGSKGDQLSGGQKQRIAIGRVLIRNPKLILLDEATSALDCENEKARNIYFRIHQNIFWIDIDCQ